MKVSEGSSLDYPIVYALLLQARRRQAYIPQVFGRHETTPSHAVNKDLMRLVSGYWRWTLKP